MHGIVYWTGYSCQNKRQNALFWARKLKKFSVEGHSPLHSPTPSPNPILSAPAAPHPIFANPPSYFFTILTLANSIGESLIHEYSTLAFCLSFNCTMIHQTNRNKTELLRPMRENILPKNTPCLTAKFTMLLLHVRLLCTMLEHGMQVHI